VSSSGTVAYAADEEPIVSKLRARSTGRAEEEYEFFSTEHGIFVGGRGPEDGSSWRSWRSLRGRLSLREMSLEVKTNIISLR